MKWEEFRDLLVGIGPDTPLGRIVAIRSEEDKEILKHFSREQHRIRSEWRSRRATKIKAETSKESQMEMLNQLKLALIDCFRR